MLKHLSLMTATAATFNISNMSGPAGKMLYNILANLVSFKLCDVYSQLLSLYESLFVKSWQTIIHTDARIHAINTIKTVEKRENVPCSRFFSAYVADKSVIMCYVKNKFSRWVDSKSCTNASWQTTEYFAKPTVSKQWSEVACTILVSSDITFAPNTVTQLTQANLKMAIGMIVCVECHRNGYTA